MKVLLVGAGAVGQVYGRHFQRGGADVAFWVKPRHAEEARRGFTMYPLNETRRSPVRFQGFDVLTALDDRKWDAVILCVSSPALRGAWLDEVGSRTGDATVVTLQPGLTDRQAIAARVGVDRLVSGMIGLLAYAAPLPGEKVPEPGTAYWFPPFQGCPFSGPDARVRPIVDVLRRGGFPAKVHADVSREIAFKGAALETVVVALECSGWSFRELRRDRELLALASRAAREVTALAERVRGETAPRGGVSPFLVRLALWAAPKLAPVDLEAFFRAHFTKVAAQTREGFVTYRELSAVHGVPIPSLEALAKRLPPLAEAAA